MNRCGFKDCKFHKNGKCTQKDGGGIPYGINVLGRLLYKKLPTEVKLYCRCCHPDIGQYNLVSRVANLLEAWDIFKLHEICKTKEEFKEEVIKIFEDKDKVKKLIQLCDELSEKKKGENLIEFNPSFLNELKEMKSIIELYENNM